ncbi:MAG: PBSX family phage terminase large subunit [Clostridia bacterium]|nr:PBSX family phage terminase large subunit [Clostridia bacterium]MBQ7982628.1 PBSX family phage terminase large subunit [Clostridia bacterium]
MSGKRSREIRRVRKSQTDAAVVDWWTRFCKTNNDTFLPLLFCRSRFLVMCGGGGSGKSIFAGRKILERCTTEAGHRVLVVRKTAKSLQESCFRQLKTQANEYYARNLASVSQNPMRLRFKNGSEIIFSGLDDVEKLKSIHGITMIWIEEASEISEYDLNQLNIRLRDACRWYKQIIITFNPISITHWLKKRFFDRVEPDCTTHRSTYKDNRFLPADAIATLENFRETDEYYYMVYCLGEWGVLGQTVFPAKTVSERLANVPQPISQGYFVYADDGVRITDIKWIEDDRNPLIAIYHAPEKGYPYIIGGDTAGEGSDRFASHVINNVTGRQEAVLLMTTGEKEFVNQMYCLGMHYNTALIGIEANFSTYPNNELQRIGYPKLYVRETLDDYTHKVRKTFGFVTNKLTRNTIIARLIHLVRSQCGLINDRKTLEEMLTFVRNEDFRPEAQEGAHDDLIMALAIAYAIRKQQRDCIEVAEDPATSVWTADMWEDYRSADRETKQYLIQKWGKPRNR